MSSYQNPQRRLCGVFSGGGGAGLGQGRDTVVSEVQPVEAGGGGWLGVSEEPSNVLHARRNQRLRI